MYRCLWECRESNAMQCNAGKVGKRSEKSEECGATFFKFEFCWESLSPLSFARPSLFYSLSLYFGDEVSGGCNGLSFVPVKLAKPIGDGSVYSKMGIIAVLVFVLFFQRRFWLCRRSIALHRGVRASAVLSRRMKRYAYRVPVDATNRIFT
jgi:hypothetical protein